MKAITLTQPWATLVGIGEKRIETRSWLTTYRGPIAIHAAKGLSPVGGKRGFESLCSTEPFCSVLNEHGQLHYEGLGDLEAITENPFMPFGRVICIARLVDIVPTREIVCEISAHEQAFGDYGDGRFAWILEGAARLENPVKAKGRLGLWEWDG